MVKYNHKKIEKKWQKFWELNQTFATPEDPKNKKYILDMFPYPSGEGLHVGHPEGYTATDIVSRYSRMKGFDVLHPMGWDAFGLPAENYAIKQGVHPKETTTKNIKRFTEQIKSLGLSYDWNREVNTSTPKYYKWTQWLFLQFYKNGLAYKKEASVNWCPKDNTVLANEQVVGGKCERCGSVVIQKLLSQWFFKITDYVEQLLSELETLDWPEPIKAMQRNWIGKSEGAEIEFRIANSELGIKVFTTRPDTLYGATYLVLAPEHSFLENQDLGIKNFDEVRKYQEETNKKSELQRTSLEKDKTGVQLEGIMAINPATGKEIPIWIADYVLNNYGTGAIMAVPSHDQRDFEFAKKFKLPILQVIKAEASLKTTLDQPFVGEGVLVNSDKYNGLDSIKAIFIMAKDFGKPKVQYKLRDWLISRQRYWGAPIPIIYCDDCGMQAVPEDQLPVELPTDVDFKPTGESPLAISKSFHNVSCPKCGKPARRDSDTMDTFVDSSWYFLRYIDSQNDQEFANKNLMKQWMPVDLYVGGAEHAVMHLLYARFFIKVLFDLNFINFKEPFLKLKNQGLILGPDGEKMSKSKGNVVNPDDIVEEFGADSLRLYEMFMGPLEDAKPWSTQGLVGMRRFLERVWVWMQSVGIKNQELGIKDSEIVQKQLHKLIKKVSEDIENFRFNTAISSFMEFYNAVKDESISIGSQKIFLTLLYPFAPHITEELYEAIGGEGSLQLVVWPSFDELLLVESTVNVIVQINGKVRDKISVPIDTKEELVKALALESEKIKTAIGNSTPKRIIIIKNKLVNIVI